METEVRAFRAFYSLKSPSKTKALSASLQKIKDLFEIGFYDSKYKFINTEKFIILIKFEEIE
jgi:competence transcription factor ComK